MVRWRAQEHSFTSGSFENPRMIEYPVPALQVSALRPYWRKLLAQALLQCSENGPLMKHISHLSTPLHFGLSMRYSLIEVYQKRVEFWYILPLMHSIKWKRASQEHRYLERTKRR